MEPLISNALKKQIKKWQLYSIIAPAGFLIFSILIYYEYGTSFDYLLYIAAAIFSVTCVVWWHWCLLTMGTMLQIMNETDKHFENVSQELESLRKSIESSKKKKFNLFDN